MVTRFPISVLICYLFLCYVRCQNTPTNSCGKDDISCQKDVADKEKNVSNSTENSSGETRLQNGIENGRARAMNFTLAFQDDMRSNGLETGLSARKTVVTKANTKEPSIDDVSMEEMEDDYNVNFTSVMSNKHVLNDMINNLQMMKNTSNGCTDHDKVYKLGEKFNRGCEESCQCLQNGIICSQLCKPNHYVKGQNKDPKCTEEAIEGNSCCVRLACAPKSDQEIEPIQDCIYKNVSYKLGNSFEDGCESVCTCEAEGRVRCKSRCPSVQNATENCVAVQDEKDRCCTILLCDVEEHDINKTPDESSITSSMADNQIISAKAINGTSVILTFSEKSKDCNVEISQNGVDWENVICIENVITNLEPGKKYHFKIKNTASNKIEVILPSSNRTMATSCSYKGKTYKIGEQFHDGCTAFCECDNTGVECAPIECPTDFGLDVLDPQCIDWETFPPDFVPTPPHCCPDKVHCRNNGSCTYNDEIFPNWTELPSKVTGCEQRCYCEMGNVSCQSVCSPISQTPPKNLHCSPEQAIIGHIPGDTCCSVWTCPNVARTGNESISMNVEYNNTIMQHNTIDQTIKQTTKTNVNDLSHNITYKQTIPQNITDLEFYPGPFSPQYFSKNENLTYGQKQQKPHQALTDLLTPFHLEEFVPEIEKELHPNTSEMEKEKKNKKPIKTHFKDEKEELGSTNYDEKDQYEDLFTDIFDSKNKNKNSSKHSFWMVKQPEIPEFVKNSNLPNINQKSPPKNKDTEIVNHSSVQISPNIPDFTKKHTTDKENDLYASKKQKPYEEVKKVSENQENNFLMYPNIPYTIPNGIYPNINTNLKYPPPEILIHQTQNPANVAYKSPAINDPNQSEEFFHIVDNDAYNDEQIRQNLPYNSQPGRHPQFEHIVKLNKDGIRIQNPNQEHVNVEDVLTHLHHENNNNVHLPNILPQGQDQQIQNVIQNFGFPHYHENYNVDQESHPLLLHPQLVNHDGNDTNRDEIKMRVLEAVDENTVRLVFSVPAFLVSLHGRIELRYTSDLQNNEPSTWEQQILAPPNDLIATKELEFELGGLQPNTTYKIKISVMMHDIDNAPYSPILTIKTLPSAIPQTTLPPILPVEPDLRTIEVNSTYAKIAWRMFNNFELTFIDGVQLRYKELDDKVYAATPLIHRAVTTYTIDQLKPDTVYEVGIFFIPFPGQTSELQAHQTIQIRTSIENDPYKFEVTMDVHHIKSTSVEISWSGVPYPEDKYVHIFRAIYQSEGSREDVSSFKAAKRDSPQSIVIQDLKPGTRYRLWLEVYLTNGRTKKSNVKDFITKLGPTNSFSSSQGKLEGMALVDSNNYYGPLVAVSILATIAIMSSIILLLILAKKHGKNKAPITSPINRKNNSSAAYDNPSYKTYENDKIGVNGKNGSIALTVFPKSHIEKEA